MKKFKHKFSTKQRRENKKMVVVGKFNKESLYGTKYCSIIQLINWLNDAQPGDDFIYAEGPSVYACEIADVVRKLTIEGEVLPLQRRENGKLKYIARKRNKSFPFNKPWVVGEE